MKPSFTLTYGLGWTLEMPPTEKFGKQIELVDDAGQQLDLKAYMNARQSAALQGQVFNPAVGFALVGNTGGGQKYPYLPFYGSFSPRLAAAWNPNIHDGFLGKMFGGNKTVIRGGYSRVYGRLNGVDLVLVPLLGTGLIQPMHSAWGRMATTLRFRRPPRHFLSRLFRESTTSRLLQVRRWMCISGPTSWIRSTLPSSGS
jgi:hypothetical protein